MEEEKKNKQTPKQKIPPDHTHHHHQSLLLVSIFLRHLYSVLYYLSIFRAFYTFSGMLRRSYLDTLLYATISFSIQCLWGLFNPLSS